MKLEYMIFNFAVILGPLILSFEKGVYYFGRWKQAFSAIIIVMIPFITWDSLVTDRHWWFNPDYTLDLRLAGLPLEEWLFFISVPFSVLFIWEIFSSKTGNPVNKKLQAVNKFLPVLILAGIFFWFGGKEYTAVVFITLGLTGLIDLFLKTEIFARPNTYIYLSMVTFLNLIFNGYLTSRPVVMYNEVYQLGFRIFTIPVEDLFYGMSVILFNTILFEKFKEVRSGK
jgi:lycopene cyclase domain-containing protein